MCLTPTDIILFQSPDFSCPLTLAPQHHRRHLTKAGSSIPPPIYNLPYLQALERNAWTPQVLCHTDQTGKRFSPLQASTATAQELQPPNHTTKHFKIIVDSTLTSAVSYFTALLLGIVSGDYTSDVFKLSSDSIFGKAQPQ